MSFFSEESSEIKDILSDIPGCAVNEFKGESEHDVLDLKMTKNSTEPNDSPFRVRRLSRSFSIPSDCKFEVGSIGDEARSNDDDISSPAARRQDELLLLDSNDENCDDSIPLNNCNFKSSKFILLRRSRSLGNIFLPELPKVSALTGREEVEDLTEKVEALEVEVLCEDAVEDNYEADKCKIDKEVESLSDSPTARAISIDRPHTSPPILYPLSSIDSDTDKSKSSILDKMQKSLGFFFKCARKDGSEADNSSVGNKTRSRTPGPTDEVPMKPVAPTDAKSFVTRVDEHPKCGDVLKKLPQFHDVSGPKGPLLSPCRLVDSGKKCLVLDLDETLVHSSFHVPDVHDLVVSLGLPDGSHQNIYVAKRPGVDQFLAKVCEQFEVVIFTASLAHYADPVIDFLCDGMNFHLREPRTIPLRLYRESCLFLRGLYVKDLSRLGRNLEHTVIVDNSPASFLLQPDHGIPIKSWFSDASDRELFHLQASLDHFVDAESVQDWRKIISNSF
jgi:Dullard-like phosphatase family protein